MPLSEYDSKEALRVAADWLTASELPGSAAALLKGSQIPFHWS